MPWMKALRKPRLNRTAVRVAVDTAVNFSRVFSLSYIALPFCDGPFAPSRRVVNSCGQTSRLVYEHRIYAASYDGAAPWRRLTSYSRGQSPKIYDRFLVPLIFESYASDLAERLARLEPRGVLETAAGTGGLTRAIASRPPAPARTRA